jgi:hypothetical protein
LKDEEKDRKAKQTGPSQESGAIADKVEAERKADVTVHLQWRDWIALTIASLETILLPVVAIVAVLIILAILFGHFW